MLAPEAPRWPALRAGRGHYESFYVRAVDPRRPRGVWIRYTVSVPPHGGPSGRLWCVLFDRDRPAPVALRADAGPVTTGNGSLLGLGTSTFDEGAADGALDTSAGSAQWSLRWAAGAPPLLHLPRAVYGTRLPRTKLISLNPATVFDGRLVVDGEEISVERWSGMVGHNWGEEHAAHWMWLHGVDFAGAGPDTWLDLALARIRIGSALSPWSAFGAASTGGRRIILGGPGRRISVREEPTGCRVRIRGWGLRATVDVSAPADAFAAWDYPAPDPAAPPRDVVNCSVADLTLQVERSGQPTRQLVAAATGVYERGRERTGRA